MISFAILSKVINVKYFLKDYFVGGVNGVSKVKEYVKFNIFLHI